MACHIDLVIFQRNFLFCASLSFPGGFVTQPRLQLSLLRDAGMFNWSTRRDLPLSQVSRVQAADSGSSGPNLTQNAIQETKSAIVAFAGNVPDLTASQQTSHGQCRQRLSAHGCFHNHTLTKDQEKQEAQSLGGSVSHCDESIAFAGSQELSRITAPIVSSDNTDDEIILPTKGPDRPSGIIQATKAAAKPSVFAAATYKHACTTNAGIQTS